MNLATKNMAASTDPPHSAAPRIEVMQPSCIDLNRPYLSQVQAVKSAASNDPAELTPLNEPMSSAVCSYPGSPGAARPISTKKDGWPMVELMTDMP